METIAEKAKAIATAFYAKENPYANGKGRAIVERLIQDKKEEQENAKREYEQNPEIRKMYDRLEKKTILKNEEVER